MPNWLRWILLVSASLFAGYVAYLVGGFVNRLSITVFLGPPEGWVQIAAIFMEQLYMGAAIPYAAGRIAPNNKVWAVLGFSMLVMVFAGVSLGIWLTHASSNTLTDQIASIAGIIGGAAGVGAAVYRDELNLGSVV